MEFKQSLKPSYYTSLFTISVCLIFWIEALCSHFPMR